MVGAGETVRHAVTGVIHSVEVSLTRGLWGARREVSTELQSDITESQSYSHFVIVPVPAIDGGDLEGPPGDLCGEAGTVL